MGILRKIQKAYDVLTEDDSIAKGNEFETYVVDHFNPKYFSVVSWTTDNTRKHDRLVEADMDPDLIMRYIPTDEEFCVECKFRSCLCDDKLEWSNPQQLRRYQDFSEENDLPFFIVIGLGGDSSYPDRMFCIPLEEAKYPGLYPSIFEEFERDPNQNFFWKNGMLS